MQKILGSPIIDEIKIELQKFPHHLAWQIQQYVVLQNFCARRHTGTFFPGDIQHSFLNQSTASMVGIRKTETTSISKFCNASRDQAFVLSVHIITFSADYTAHGFSTLLLAFGLFCYSHHSDGWKPSACQGQLLHVTFSLVFPAVRTLNLFRQEEDFCFCPLLWFILCGYSC